MLCICRSDVLLHHRTAARGQRLIVPLSLLVPALESHRNAKLCYLFFGTGSIEVDLFDDAHLFSSTVLKRDETGRFDSDELATILKRFDTDVVEAVVQDGEDDTAFRTCEALKTESVEVRTSNLDSALEGIGRRYPLFQVHRSRNRTLSRLALPVMTVIVLVLAVLTVHKAVLREQALSTRLDGELTATEVEADRSARLENEVALLRDQVEILTQRVYVQPYLVLSELTRIFGSDVLIESFLLERDFFQIEAVAPDPLVIMQRFDGHAQLKNLRITQLSQDGDTGRMRFTLTGEFHGE